MSATMPGPQGRNGLTDVKTLREQARRHIEEGAVTENYHADREKVVEMLNEALATELVCVLRYRHDYFMARGRDSKAAAAELAESSRFLSRSISSDCDDLIEMYYASFRASKSKFCGVRQHCSMAAALRAG